MNPLPALPYTCSKVMSESEHVQNDPKQGFIPQEGLVAAHLVEALKPFSEENGGQYTTLSCVVFEL